MFQNLDVFKTAIAMARHAGHQQALSAQNIANADTPGYRAKELMDFRKTVRKPQSSAPRSTRASHLNGSATSQPKITTRSNAHDPNENTVSLELEMVNAVNAKRQHDRALAIYRSNLSILRASIGSK